MDYENIISDIEEKFIILSNNNYYHAFQYQKESFISMLTKGIKSPILLRRSPEGNNGPFYVSLSKKEKCQNSIYDKLSNNPMFVINENINTIKTRNLKKEGHYPIFFINSALSFRESEYDNEYQKFLKVSPKDIVAIQYNIFEFYKLSNNNEYLKNQLLILKQTIEDLKALDIKLPIIDISTSREINQTKVLSLKINQN